MEAMAVTACCMTLIERYSYLIPYAFNLSEGYY